MHVISLETAYAWAPYVILADAGLRVVSHTIESMPVSVACGFPRLHLFARLLADMACRRIHLLCDG